MPQVPSLWFPATDSRAAEPHGASAGPTAPIVPPRNKALVETDAGRDNMSDCLEALEASLRELSSALGDLISPRPQSEAGRPRNKPPHGPIFDFDSSRTSELTNASIAGAQKTRWSPRAVPPLGPQGPVATAKAGCVVAKRRATSILRQAFPWSFVLPLIPVAFSVAFYLLAPSKVANKSREALVQQNTTAVERSAALDQTVANALQNAVNVSGSIRANSVGVRGGKIVLHDGDSDHRRE